LNKKQSKLGVNNVFKKAEKPVDNIVKKQDDPFTHILSTGYYTPIPTLSGTF